jgi:hypothetical protein
MDGPGIGPSLEWRREQRDDVIAEVPTPAGPTVDRSTVAAWLVFLGRAVPHPPSSTEGGQGRALPGRRDWRDPDHDVADPGQQVWHNAWAPPPWRRDDDQGARLDQLERLERLRRDRWPV